MFSDCNTCDERRERRVCGDDGVSYRNRCAAKCAGAKIDRTGQSCGDGGDGGEGGGSDGGDDGDDDGGRGNGRRDRDDRRRDRGNRKERRRDRGEGEAAEGEFTLASLLDPRD